MKQSQSWVFQAKSDLAAAQAVYREADSSTYCQAIAKYQQTVEKSVKGMIAALQELGLSGFQFGGGHSLDPEMKHLDTLRRKPDLAASSAGIINQIVAGHGADITQLCALAPSMRSTAHGFPRNTEYPFNDSSVEGWTAPSVDGVYTREEVSKAHRTAWRVHHSVARLVSSLRRR